VGDWGVDCEALEQRTDEAFWSAFAVRLRSLPALPLYAWRRAPAAVEA